MRRPQKSELMRSSSFQSGPASSSTTFLPAFASTAANAVPEEPAPTMTASPFSLAMARSPALLRRTVRRVGNSEFCVPLHGAVYDVAGVRAQNEIDKTAGRALPAVDLVLPHVLDKGAGFLGIELAQPSAAMTCLAGAL